MINGDTGSCNIGTYTSRRSQVLIILAFKVDILCLQLWRRLHTTWYLMASFGSSDKKATLLPLSYGTVRRSTVYC